MIRPGHHRPLGTTTWLRFPYWHRHARAPQLLDIISQISYPEADDADYVQRSYEVVGVERTKTGYRLLCERVAYGTVPASGYPEAMWTFFNYPRR